MRLTRLSGVATLFCISLLIATTTTTRGGFFDNLNKGIDKWNNTVDNLNKTVNDADSSSAAKSSTQNADESSAEVLAHADKGIYLQFECVVGSFLVRLDANQIEFTKNVFLKRGGGGDGNLIQLATDIYRPFLGDMAVANNDGLTVLSTNDELVLCKKDKEHYFIRSQTDLQTGGEIIGNIVEGKDSIVQSTVLLNTHGIKNSNIMANGPISPYKKAPKAFFADTFSIGDFKSKNEAAIAGGSKQVTAAVEQQKAESDRDNQFHSGNLTDAIQLAKQKKSENKLVFKNLYLGMPLKNAVVVLESLLGKKLDLKGNSQNGFQLGIYSNRSQPQTMLEIIAAKVNDSKVRYDGTIVTADGNGNCVQFNFGRSELDGIFKTPELEGVKFFHEFTKNYNVEFDLDSYMPKMNTILPNPRINFGKHLTYEALDSRGVKLYYIVNSYNNTESKNAAMVYGLSPETLIIEAVATQSERTGKFD